MSTCSIVIPVRDRAPLTRQCLDAVLGCSTSVPFDVVVVDDGATDTTASVLSEYGSRIEVVTHDRSRGFAAACNAGAAACSGDLVVFLNNDTLPQPGWLDALVAHAAPRPRTAAVGARLLFPNGLVQHAGVVVCEDGIPRNLYAGFPSDHPAVAKDRLVQAVTGACMLVRRAAFEEVGGFDTAFRNGFEDADLCFRLRERGWEVHYCHSSVAYHLESATRSRRAHESRRNLELFRSRWSRRLVPDEIATYLADGLLEIGYEDIYPLRLRVSPLLATIDPGSREAELERVLQVRSRQVVDLLREVTRLTSRVAGRALEDFENEATPPSDAGAHAALAKRDEEILRDLAQLQARLAEAVEATSAAEPFEPSPTLGYRELVDRVRRAVVETVPPGAHVLVVSSGDDDLLALEGRSGSHFPQGPSGGYAGHHPADGEAALSQLEELRAQGAQYLVLPATSLWWLDHYAVLGAHLEAHDEPLLCDDEVCWIFALEAPVQTRPSVLEETAR